jgi:hypothetical protein
MAASLPSSARPVDPALTLGYNGRPQSFSHLAALALASDPARCSPYERLADLVEAVTKGWGGAEIDTRLDMPAMLFFLSIGSFFFCFFFFSIFFFDDDVESASLADNLALFFFFFFFFFPFFFSLPQHRVARRGPR